jgi:hypothetical protein
MRHLLAVQTAGSLIALSVIALAEAAALLLAHFPSSMLLWYLNQEVFHGLEIARASQAPLVHLLINQTTLFWDLGLILVVLLVYRARWRFGAALISHACLIVVGLITCYWAVAMKLPMTASLKPVIAAFGQTNGAVLLLAGGAALLSAVLAHLTYFAAIRSDWRGRTHDRGAHSHRVGGDTDFCDLRRSSKSPDPE